jgi:hypothetical protein
MPHPRYWTGDVPAFDDFGKSIANSFVDGKTTTGHWAIMSLYSWSMYGVGKLGPGLGQKYMRQLDGRWLKVEDQ